MSEPNDSNVQVIENATRKDVRPGDHITWEQAEVRYGVTRFTRREGIAHDLDEWGDWRTVEGGLLTDGEGGLLTDGEGRHITITIRRPAQQIPADLPTEPGAVIVPADGHEYIEAAERGRTCRAREAVLGLGSHWYAAWRSDAVLCGLIPPECITPGTWKVADQ